MDCPGRLSCVGISKRDNLVISSKSFAYHSKWLFHTSGTSCSFQMMINLQNLLHYFGQRKLSFTVNIDVLDEITLEKMLGWSKKMLKMEWIHFKVSDVNTSDGFGMPPQLPSPYPCNNCDMDSDKMSHANRLTSPSLLFLLQEVTVSFLTSDRSFVIVLACEHAVIEISTV